jgi:hypothetical protein
MDLKTTSIEHLSRLEEIQFTDVGVRERKTPMRRMEHKGKDERRGKDVDL